MTAALIAAAVPYVMAPAALAGPLPAARATDTVTAASKVAVGPTAGPTPKPTTSHGTPPPSSRQKAFPSATAALPNPSATCRPFFPGSPQPQSQGLWAQRSLGITDAWTLTRGQGVTVAVVDSGIDYTPLLAGRVTATSLTGKGLADCAGH